MKRFLAVTVVVLGVFSSLPGSAGAAEYEALEALEKVRQGIEEGVSYGRLGLLLDEAQSAVRTLQRGVTQECFRIAAITCYHWYDLGRKSWGALIENQQKRDFYARQLESVYYDDQMKAIFPIVIDNYDKLIRHAEESLPSNWENGHAALERARECPRDRR
jgi:hypothetical protein